MCVYMCVQLTSLIRSICNRCKIRAERIKLLFGYFLSPCFIYAYIKYKNMYNIYKYINICKYINVYNEYENYVYIQDGD